MFALLIDTTLCGVQLGVAELSTQTLRYCEAESAPHGGSLSLVRLWNDAQSKLKITSSDLDVCGISVGPGSFTGIKVGLAFAYGLARGTELTLAGASSFKLVANALAAGDSAFGGLLLPLTKVRALFCSLHEQREDVNLTEIGLDDFENKKHLSDTTLYQIQSWDVLKPSISKHFRDSIVLDENKLKELSIGQLLNTVLSIPDQLISVQQEKILPLPCYLKKSAAEEKRSLQL